MKRAVHVAVLAVSGLFAVACAAADEGGGVATLGGAGQPGGATPSPSVDPEEALEQFAECMREHGVEVETAYEGEEVGIRIEARGDDVDPGTVEEADAACRDLLPQDLVEPPSAEERQEMFERALRFAECMREHGLDWPDPQESEGGGILFGPGEAFDPEDPRVAEAERDCRPILEAGRGPVREVET